MRSDLEYFEKRSEELSEDIRATGRKSLILSILRFISFIICIFSFVYGFIGGQGVLMLAGGAFLFAFFLLCYIHDGVRDRQDYLDSLYLVNQRYIARIKGDFQTLREVAVYGLKRREEIEDAIEWFSGNEFFIPDHDYCMDLDLFGKKSLFSLYNVSETQFGRKAFADELLYSPVSDLTPADIKLREEAVAELIDRVDFMESYQAISALGKLKKSPKALLGFAENGQPLGKLPIALALFAVAVWIFPVICILFFKSLIGASISAALIVNFLVWIAGLKLNADYLKAAGDMPKQVKTIWKLFVELEKANLKSPLIVSYVKGNVRRYTASESLNNLSIALFFAQLRSQPIFALLINLVCPLDYLVAYLMGRWADIYGPSLSVQIDGIAGIEALMCAAQVGIASAQSEFPTFVEAETPSDEAYFNGENIVHPLLAHETAVANSVEINSDIAIITGSNMSGKTTHIRTVGVCAILAYIGAPVPCSALRLGKMRIMSSMRIVDSLEENISTFKAELTRISKIIDGAEDGKPMLFLIDEIFRGTNSDDRTEGALTVLHNLSRDYICGMMTTHDYAMVDNTVKNFDNVRYYHFSEKYTDTGITFDYILAPGISRESNAKYLMKLVGIE